MRVGPLRGSWGLLGYNLATCTVFWDRTPLFERGKKWPSQIAISGIPIERSWRGLSESVFVSKKFAIHQELRAIKVWWSSVFFQVLHTTYKNTLSSTKPTYTTRNAIGTCDSAFERQNLSSFDCYKHHWLLWRSLISKKYAKFIFFFQFYTQKKKRLFCKMYIDARPALIDFCDSAFERRIMCFCFVISIFRFYVCHLLQNLWKVFVFFQLTLKRQKNAIYKKKNWINASANRHVRWCVQKAH